MLRYAVTICIAPLALLVLGERMNQLRPLHLSANFTSLRHLIWFARPARLLRFALGSLLCLFSFAGVASAQDSSGGLLELKTGWSLQSSAKVVGDGATFSKPGFASEGWYTTSVPTTVVGALVDFRAYPDPYFSDNLRHYPGMSYKVGENFSNEDMAKDSPFRVSLWYRTEFSVPSGWA